jgi:hypothetical protein
MDKTKSVGMGIVVGALLIVAFLTANQQVQASSNEGQSNSQNDPFNAGRDEGKEDWNKGNPKEASCSTQNSDEYCLTYQSGYNVGWASQSLLGREYGSNPP